MTRTDRIDISYDLTFSTPFHCGTGLRSGLIDRTIIRDQQGHLYVPGSTIKGVLREHCEQLARIYEELDTDIASPHDNRKALLGLGHVPTMITRIFGSHNHPAHLFFDDARQNEKDTHIYDSPDPKEENGKGKYLNLQTGQYTQVRLDRPTRTAVGGALYTSEFGIKDFIFKGHITGWLNCIEIPEISELEKNQQIAKDPEGPTYSLLLLLAGLLMLDRLGGNKSAGKGQCRAKITQFNFRGEPYKDDRWKAWFDHLGLLSDYSLYAQEVEA